MENKKKRRFLPCPNCQENMLQKASQSIPFLEKGIVIFLVQACVDCLSNPDALDEERIFISLRAEEWPEDAARKAAKALIGEARKRAFPSKPVPVENILASTVAA